MVPWYRVVTPRREVREGHSFNPDEFAIALEQVVAGTAPEDYRDPAQFFARTCWTRALREYTGMVLRRLAGRTDNTAPVLTLITQFGRTVRSAPRSSSWSRPRPSARTGWRNRTKGAGEPAGRRVRVSDGERALQAGRNT